VEQFAAHSDEKVMNIIRNIHAVAAASLIRAPHGYQADMRAAVLLQHVHTVDTAVVVHACEHIEFGAALLLVFGTLFRQTPFCKSFAMLLATECKLFLSLCDCA